MVPLSAKHRRQHGLPSDPSCGKQPQAKNVDRQRPSFHTHKRNGQESSEQCQRLVPGQRSWFPREDNIEKDTNGQLRTTGTITADMTEGQLINS